jgi:hypothetical protein
MKALARDPHRAHPNALTFQERGSAPCRLKSWPSSPDAGSSFRCGRDRRRLRRPVALRHQVAVLERQLEQRRVRLPRQTGRCWQRCCTACHGRRCVGRIWVVAGRLRRGMASVPRESSFSRWPVLVNLYGEGVKAGGADRPRLEVATVELLPVSCLPGDAETPRVDPGGAERLPHRAGCGRR